MASNDNDIPGDRRLFNHLKSYLPYMGYKKSDLKVFSKQVSDGLLNAGSFVETVGAYIGGMLKDARVGRDWDDGSDSKKSTVGKDGDGRLRIPVKNFKNKAGGLRILADAHVIKAGWIMLCVPPSEYLHLKGKQFKIEVDTTGNVVGKYAAYQVNSLAELYRTTILHDSIERKDYHPVGHIEIFGDGLFSIEKK